MRLTICHTAARGLIGALLLGFTSAPAAGQCQVVELLGDTPDDGFGYAVGISAERAAIRAKFSGGPGGAVRVFERSGSSWSCVAELVADDHAPGTGFANSLAIDGDRLVVGARYDDTQEPRTGSAYVFEYSDGSWSQAGKLVGDDVAEGGRFGHAVAISGDMAVVGAPDDDAMGFRSGSAYVFERQPDGTWTQLQKLTASDGAPVDHFGDAVAISGTIIVVGAQDDDDLGWNSGSAYVFERFLSGLWFQVAKLRASNGKFLDAFGSSVAVDGNTALIGSPGAHGLGYWEGAAYVFERPSDGTWSEIAKLFANDGENSDKFGYGVGVNGNLALVGAVNYGQAWWQTGAVYVFVRNEDDTWSQVAKLVPDDGEHLDYFGRAVAVSGNIAVVATYPQDPNEPPKPGMAYVYAVGPDEDGDGVMDACECPGDVNHDWIVDFLDVLVLLEDWGCDGGDCPGDADRDGDTDQSDLGLLLANWGVICP
ncbi:MAG TPA: FG-GAP repeat protein [Phycisphaerae bacterium]|nr:FG-GAP repeat protein [Phycisphaerae bacterium]